MLRNSLNRAVNKRDTFLFPMEKSVLYILHLENRVSEKVITIYVLEELWYRAPGVDVKVYFADVENLVNNGILSAENRIWMLPVNGDTLSTL